MLSASENTINLPEFIGNLPNIAIINSYYYSNVSKNLIRGAVANLKKGGIPHEIFNVSGVLDLPTALKLIINSTRFEGYILLGSILTGGNDLITSAMYAETLRGIGTIAGQGYPLGTAIICAESEDNLLEMASIQEDNCGGKASQAALELVALARSVSGITKNIGFKPASKFIQMAGEASKTK